MNFLPGDIAFTLVDTHGAALEDVVNIAAEKGLRVQWLLFLAAAAKAGWKPKTVLAKIEEACLDCTVESERAHGLSVVDRFRKCK